MKVYFANKKYLNIDNFEESYRAGFRYLTFIINDSNLSFESIFNFLSNEEVLSQIIITNNQNESIVMFNNIYHSINEIHCNISENGNSSINVRLSSSKDGKEYSASQLEK